MNTRNFQIYFDCGSSKIRAGAFKKNNPNKFFYTESKFFSDHSTIDLDIQKIITYLEKKTNEYLDDVNLMIDDPKMLSIGLSVSKKFDGSRLKQEDVQFLIQEAKQQILINYKSQNIVHIIINNYKINDIEYMFLPNEIECNSIVIDIFFICLPKKKIEYLKKIFFKSDILVNQIICSSYAKSINYKNNIFFNESATFIDIGFNKTTIICYSKNKIVSLDTLSIGGNHITKDISKILKIDLNQAEKMKLNFINSLSFSSDLLKKIIFARVEEILELSEKSIGLNLTILNKPQIFLIGESSKILNSQHKDKITFIDNMEILKETDKDICLSGLKLAMGLNKQEVVMIPKKQIKQGLFEKLFHFFK